jgi:protease-4
MDRKKTDNINWTLVLFVAVIVVALVGGYFISSDVLSDPGLSGSAAAGQVLLYLLPFLIAAFLVVGLMRVFTDKELGAKWLAALRGNKKKTKVNWTMVLFVIITIVAIAGGYYLSDTLNPKPIIGVVRVDWEIDYQIQAYFLYPLNYAYENDDIAAVVLVIDSPGGSAALSEELFYRILELREKKPVVATIDRLGASGAYYIASASNYIYSKPAAFVGSIGVISSAPREVKPTESILTTGPFKGSGASLVDWVRSMDIIKDIFVTNVYDQRLYALDNMHDPSLADILPDRDLIATGQVWIAPAARDIGLVDEIGSNLDAIAKAAELAHVRNYRVLDLTYYVLFGDETTIYSNTFTDEPLPIEAKTLPDFEPVNDYIEAGPWQKLYFLYEPPVD